VLAGAQLLTVAALAACALAAQRPDNRSCLKPPCFDTSIDYGRSEELIGRYLGHRRDEYFLASKCGCLLEPPPGTTPPFPHDYSAGNVRAGVEQSLRRLGTDRLDLVQVHMSPSRGGSSASNSTGSWAPS